MDVLAGAVQPTGGAKIVQVDGFCAASVAEFHTRPYRFIA